VIANVDTAQLIDAAEIDQEGRRSQPELQRRDQCMAAGEQLGVVGIVLQQADRLGKRGCANVVE
jgi:hypothetical protein